MVVPRAGLVGLPEVGYRGKSTLVLRLLHLVFLTAFKVYYIFKDWTQVTRSLANIILWAYFMKLIFSLLNIIPSTKKKKKKVTEGASVDPVCLLLS